MEKQDLNTRKNQYLASIINSIQMTVTDFMQGLAKGEEYERMIFNRTIDFFNRDIPVNKAIENVHQLRMLILHHKNEESEIEKKNLINKKKVLSKIKSEFDYGLFGEQTKNIVKERINSLIATNLYSNYTIFNMIKSLLENRNEAIKRKSGVIDFLH